MYINMYIYEVQSDNEVKGWGGDTLLLRYYNFVPDILNNMLRTLD